MNQTRAILLKGSLGWEKKEEKKEKDFVYVISYILYELIL